MTDTSCIDCEQDLDIDLEAKFCPLCGEGPYCDADLDAHLRRYPSHNDPEKKEQLQCL